ncbi:MAG: thioredoxin-disulfide reductase [Candidatus Andersenbacteria bacterium]
MQPGIRSVVIIGSGPAGLTAAIYTARAELKPLVCAGATPGGQLMITSEVENFPGFPKGILGPDLMKSMREQAQRFGAEIIDVNVDAVDLSKKPFVVTAGGKQIQTHSIVIATGASSKWLGLPSEQALIGHGVSSCATCDGFFFKGKEVVVVGGGDAAMEEALFLTKFATKVTVVHRRDSLRASKIMQERAKKNPKISFIWNSEVAEVLGKEHVTGVRLREVNTKKETEFTTDGLFVAIGHAPNTPFLKGQITVDKKGYVVVKNNTLTSVEGVFVAGDVQDYRYRQAITAAGLGCMAGMDAERWLSDRGLAGGTAPTSSYGG